MLLLFYDNKYRGYFFLNICVSIILSRNHLFILFKCVFFFLIILINKIIYYKCALIQIGHCMARACLQASLTWLTLLTRIKIITQVGFYLFIFWYWV